MAKLAEAINLYNPSAQWTLLGDDYATLEWHSVDIAKPTKAKLESLLLEVEAAKAQQEADKAAAKTAAEAKLALLGLTSADLKALGL
jgi:hypothetical protein